MCRRGSTYDSPLVILEHVLDLGVTVGERPKDPGETVEHDLSSSDWLTQRNLNVRRVVVIERSGCRSVTSVEDGYPPRSGLVWVSSWHNACDAALTPGVTGCASIAGHYYETAF